MIQELEMPVEVAQDRLNAALRELLHDPLWDRRGERRLPYFGPVTLTFPLDPQAPRSAFVRDLSPVGIGLVHLMPLEPGRMTVALPLPAGQDLILLAELSWCRDYGNGWYSSGGRLLDAVKPPEDPASVFLRQALDWLRSTRVREGEPIEGLSVTPLKR